MTHHFKQRVRERMGPDVDADLLAEAIRWAIKNERWDLVRYHGRVARKGLRIFEFRAAPSGDHFFALVDTRTYTPVTLMPEGYIVNRQGKPPIELRRTA